MVLQTTGQIETDIAAGIHSLRQRDPQRHRVTVLRGDWSSLLESAIRKLHYSRVFAEHVLKFATTSVNVGLSVTTHVAAVYKMGARRWVEDQRSMDALSAFYDEAAVDQQAVWWNRLAFGAGPVLVVPVVTADGVGRVRTLPSDRFEYTIRPDDGDDGEPVVAVWRQGDRYEAADAEAFYELSDLGELISVRPHGAGVCPGVVFRSRLPNPDDPWDVAATAPLLHGTLLVAYYLARLHMRRKQQDGLAVSMIGDLGSIPPGQVLLSGEQPLVFDASPGQQIQLQRLDLNLTPDEHIRHIRMIIESTVEQYGIPQSSVTFDDIGKETMSISVRMAHERLSLVRAEQIPWFRRAERALAIKAALVMVGMRHHAWTQIDPLAVAETFRVEFPDLNRVGDPLQLSQLEDWELGHMLIDEIDLVQRRFPEMSRQQAEEYLLRKMATRASIAEELARRNLVLDVQRGMLSTPEVFGRMGGRPRNEDANGQQ